MRTCMQRLCATDGVQLTCIDILFMRSLLLPTNTTGWKVSVFSWHSRNNGIHLSLTFCRLASSTTENTRHTTSAWRICSHSSSWSCSFSEEKNQKKMKQQTARVFNIRPETHRDNRLCPWAPVRASLRREWLSFRHVRAPRPGILRWPATVWWTSCRRPGRPPKGCAPTVRFVWTPFQTETLFGWNAQTNFGQPRWSRRRVALVIRDRKKLSPRESHR